jgi:primosomal protein N' (replication factor Y)
MPPITDPPSRERAAALYANVAVDQPVDATYSYIVPKELHGRVVAGSRVVIPLGRGNRLSEGTVLEVSDKPPIVDKAEPSAGAEEGSLFEADALESRQGLPSAAAGIKPLADLLADVMPVPGDLLDLAKWISTYYCAPIGMTLATMVPAAVKRGTRLPANILVSLTDATRGPAEQLAGKKLSSRTRGIFEKLFPLLQGGAKREQEVLSHAQIARPALKRLLDLALLTARREIKLPEHAPIGAALQLIESQRQKIEALTADQEKALHELAPLLKGGQSAAKGEPAPTDGTGGFAVRLIHGVTGSGKTELYIRAIEQVVARGKRAIVLVPEISLTPQTVRRFTARFPRVAVLHSGLKDSERHQHWHAIASGWAQVIVGARSAIFAPARDIGLIIVDEEHDSSYKQDATPKYHGRDVAIRRAQMLNIPVLLGSATPALESWHNAHHHPHWGLLSLRSRPLGTQMPRVLTVDMKAEAKVRRGLHILSTVLEHHLKQTLEAKKQAIFLLNRRGYAHYLMCPRCDWVLMCDNCDATMVVHRTRSDEATERRSDGREEGAKRPNEKDFKAGARRAARDSAAPSPLRRSVASSLSSSQLRGTVQCHYCLTSMMLPETCPLCKARLTHLGQGTQRAEDELLRKFPELAGGRLKRMDSDSMSNLGEYQKALDAFGRGEIDLLIGTQMIAKGLDFPNVTLVGVLNSDLAMTMPDFRAAERTFQLICQVAGRSGRSGGGTRGSGESPPRGTVIVQTFQPQEPAIAFACQHDYQGFVNSELPHRKEFGYPPYGRLVRIVLSHKGYETVRSVGEGLVRLILALTQKLNLPVRVHGPIPPPMERLMEQYRVEIVLFSDSALPLQRLIGSLRARGVLASHKVSVSVDVDPLHML